MHRFVLLQVTRCNSEVLSVLSISIPLYNQNIFVCLFYDFLMARLGVIMLRYLCFNLCMMAVLKGAVLKQIEIRLQETGRNPKTVLFISLCTRNPNPYCMFVFFSTEINIESVFYHISPNVFERISQSSSMSHDSYPLYESAL